MPVQGGVSRDVVLKTCKEDGEAFRYASDRHRSDKEIAIAACSNYGLALEYTSRTLQNDKDVVLTACRNNGNALLFASKKLRGDKDVVFTACHTSSFLNNNNNIGDYHHHHHHDGGDVFSYASDDLRNDRDFVLKLCREAGAWKALEYCSEEFTADEEVVLTACSKGSGMAFEFAQKSFRHDKSMVFKACKADGIALKYAASTFKSDLDIVMAAVLSNGMALQYVSEELRDRKDVVLASVHSNGMALKYTSKELRDKKEIVLAAVKSRGMALGYASQELRSTKEIVLAAVRTNPEALKFALGGLNQNKDCLIAANLWDKSYSKNSIFRRPLHPSLGGEEQESSPIYYSTVEDDILRGYKCKKIVLSTRFSLSARSSAHATTFAVKLKQHPYISGGNFAVYSPNAFNKRTCDPNWTDFDWPCRGTYETCEMPHDLKTRNNNNKKPTDACCWRYSFRHHLQEARNSNGFMIQVLDYEELDITDQALNFHSNRIYPNHEMGNGQRIETDMAQQVQVKVFRFFQPKDNISYDMKINELVSDIKKWYDSGCKNMRECNSGHDDCLLDDDITTTSSDDDSLFDYYVQKGVDNFMDFGQLPPAGGGNDEIVLVASSTPTTTPTTTSSSVFLSSSFEFKTILSKIDEPENGSPVSTESEVSKEMTDLVVVPNNHDIHESVLVDEIQHVIDKQIHDQCGEQGVYTGTISNYTGMPHGKGRMKYAKKGRSYDGQWSHGRWNGEGCLRDGCDHDNDSNAYYQGCFENHQKHGYGVMHFADGRIFEGDYVNGQMVKGKMTYQDGSTYDGAWLNGTRHGHGKCIYIDGSEYEGEFQEGDFHGYGKMTWYDGGWYLGEWSNGEMHGQGKEIRPDGSLRHDGAWSRGKPIRTKPQDLKKTPSQHRLFALRRTFSPSKFIKNHIMAAAEKESSNRSSSSNSCDDGDHYEGNYKNGQKHGPGIMHFANGRVFEGQYVDDEMFHGKMTYNNGSVYIGSWLDGMRHGHGKHIFLDGTIYEGEFRFGYYHGRGKMTWAKGGGWYVGEWFEGKRHGQGKEICSDGSLQHDGEWCHGQPIHKRQ